MIKTVLDFATRKSQGQKLSMVTCYDYTMARAVAQSQVDCILVGDSLMMTIYGEKDTLKATPQLLARHTQAVRKGAPQHFIVADMPFMADRGSIDRAIDAAAMLLRAGAQAVKIEGAKSITCIRHLIESGVPVMGHLGLTPQSYNNFGGFRVQAKDASAKEQLRADARALFEAGCFALVLESVPSSIAQEISGSLPIPVIGIGAGNNVDGQVLVLQDLLGLNEDFQPKFVRRFAEGAKDFVSALNAYHAAVEEKSFPSQSESYL